MLLKIYNKYKNILLKIKQNFLANQNILIFFKFLKNKIIWDKKEPVHFQILSIHNNSQGKVDYHYYCLIYYHQRIYFCIVI